jgi:hypothetical protein
LMLSLKTGLLFDQCGLVGQYRSDRRLDSEQEY